MEIGIGEGSGGRAKRQPRCIHERTWQRRQCRKGLLMNGNSGAAVKCHVTQKKFLRLDR